METRVRSYLFCLLLVKSTAFQGTCLRKGSHGSGMFQEPVVSHEASITIDKRRSCHLCDGRRSRCAARSIHVAADGGSSPEVPYGLAVDAVEAENEVNALKRHETLIRVILPAALLASAATLSFPHLSLAIKSLLDTGELSVIGNDSSQFIQNFVTVNGLTLSILAGNTFIFLYQQTESIYKALYKEVSEAKSLLEQSALVCAGRPFYKDVLFAIQRYVANDLRRLDYSPATLLSARPRDDPLESILYLTSVGVPSVIYETVRSLRAARAERLGACQRKLPEMHFWLLCFLSLLELMSFPLLGAGTASLFSDTILSVQSILFGLLAGTLTMTLRIIRELWFPVGGAYNVDGVLSVMARGLEDETSARLSGLTFAIEAGAGPGGPPPYRRGDQLGTGRDDQGGGSSQVLPPSPQAAFVFGSTIDKETVPATASVAETETAGAVQAVIVSRDPQSETTSSDDSDHEAEAPQRHRRCRIQKRAVSLAVVALGFVLWGLQVRHLI